MHPWGWWGFWPLIPFFWIGWIGLVAFLCWGVGRRFGLRGRSNAANITNAGYRPTHTPVEQAEPSAMEILRRRYARGEIDLTTFEQMCERLERSNMEHAPYPYE